MILMKQLLVLVWFLDVLGMVLGILLFLFPLRLFQCVLHCHVLFPVFYSALFETLWEGFSSHPARHPCCLCAFKPDLAFRRSLGDAESIDIRIYLASPANDEQHNDYTMLIHVDYNTI